MIICVKIPYLAAALEADGLQGPPLIIEHPAGQVHAVSREAHERGIVPGMSAQEASSRCPEATWTPARLDLYQRIEAEIELVMADFTPSVEMEATSLSATCFGSLGAAETSILTKAQSIGQAIRDRAHLSPSIGLAESRFVAHVAAALIDEDEALFVAPDQQAEFLSPLPLGLLPLDEEGARRFHLLGIRTMGELVALPVGSLLNQLGAAGRIVHRLAQGIDHRPVRAYRPQEEERLTRHLEDPIRDIETLQRLLISLSEELAQKLASKVSAARDISLSLHLEDGEEVSARRVLQRPINSAKRLHYNACQLLFQLQPSCAVSGLELVLRDLVSATGHQLDLFCHAVEGERWRDLLKDLGARYGSDRFFRVSLLDQDAYLPERRFRLRRAGP